MLAAYGVDVLDPKVSLRRIWVLAHRLRPGFSSDQDDDLSWSIEAHLLAAVLDALARLQYITLCAWGGKNKPEKPKPFPRPSTRRKQPPTQPARQRWSDLARQMIASHREK